MVYMEDSLPADEQLIQGDVMSINASRRSNINRHCRRQTCDTLQDNTD